MIFRKIVALFFAMIRKNNLAAKVLGVHFLEGCKFIGNPISIFGSEPWAITIGSHVEITNGVQIITHDGALWTLRDRPDYQNADIIKKVIIGNNVFIGVNCVILAGVTIGNNVIIGAGTIVNKDIPDNSVAVGCPVKVVKSIEDYESKVSEIGFLNTKQMSRKKKKEIWEKEFGDGID